MSKRIQNSALVAGVFATSLLALHFLTAEVDNFFR